MAGRLRWHCRRGMQELDVLLNRWLDANSQASSFEISVFERLLALQDPELARYLLAGDISADAELAALCLRIRGLQPGH